MIEQLFYEKTGINFDDFYKKYRPKLIWYLMRMSNDLAEAEEVADDGFEKALNEIRKYDFEKSQFSTWLFTITKRLMIQRMKVKKKFESIEEDHDGANIGDFLMSDNRNMNMVDTMILKKAEIIKRKITDLPKKYATVLTMREIDGFTYKEISDVLKLNENTIKSRIRQGRLLLQKYIKPELERLDKGSFWEIDHTGV